MDADEDESFWYWLVLAALFIVFRLTALAVGLDAKVKKFY
jgi:hypothetical protein